MTTLIFLCSVIYLFSSGNAAVAPFIKPCKVFQNDDECLLKSAQLALPYLADGLPDLGIPSADPLTLDNQKHIDRDLRLKFKNITIIGIKKCKFNKLKINSKNSATVVLECPIKATGKYEVKGKIFVLPLEGAGDFTIKTKKVKLSMKIQFDEVDGADGKRHWRIISVEKSYEALEPVRFDLKNLFNGNEEQSKLVIDTLNASWRELLVIGDPIIQNVILKVEGIIRKFYDAVPVDELYIE